MPLQQKHWEKYNQPNEFGLTVCLGHGIFWNLTSDTLVDDFIYVISEFWFTFFSLSLSGELLLAAVVDICGTIAVIS